MDMVRIIDALVTLNEDDELQRGGEVDLVHIVRPSQLQFCVGDNCSRPECLQALHDDTPLLCEALSQEDAERIGVTHGEDKLREVYGVEGIYQIGLAFLVLIAEFENRKKYKARDLGEAIFAFLRASRDDSTYLKRLLVILFSVARTREHFTNADLETMFGEQAATILSILTPLPSEALDTAPYLERVADDPLATEVATYYYKAKLDWLRVVGGGKPEWRKWRKCLNLINNRVNPPELVMPLTSHLPPTS